MHQRVNILELQEVSLRKVCKLFPGADGGVKALEDFGCDIAQGEFAAILGPSGCGKSTVIRIIAGLEKATSGTVLVKGEPVTQPGLDCSMVFQAYTSFPWLSVIDNVAFGLRYTHKGSRAERLQRAQEYIDMVGLADFAHAMIRQLSGGMRQRVALASALATDPDVLLMDEPFGALDSQTRLVMQEHLIGICEKASKTVVFVTHDIEEALLLADRVYVCTARPARVLAEIDVPVGRPRTIEVKSQQLFLRKKMEVFHLLRDEVLKGTLATRHAERRSRTLREKQK